jgi:hypothetical protein
MEEQIASLANAPSLIGLLSLNRLIAFFVSEFRANSRLGEPFCVTRGRPKQTKMRSITLPSSLRLTTFSSTRQPALQ